MNPSNRLFTVLGLVTLFILVLTAWTREAHQYWGDVGVRTANGLTITFFIKPEADERTCRARTEAFVAAMRIGCPLCRIQFAQCLTEPSVSARRALGGAPLPMPSVGIDNGVITFSSADRSTAMAVCRQTAQLVDVPQSSLQCDAANTSRVNGLAVVRPGVARSTTQLLVGALAAFIGTLLIGYLIVRYEPLHARLTHDRSTGGPQKFHIRPTPRVGGIALCVGLLAAAISLMLLPGSDIGTQAFMFLIVASAPAFFGGIIEDLTKRVGVWERLMLTMISAAIGTILLDAVLNRVGVPLFDSLIMVSWFAVPFTIFAISGLANAVNVIDGYNGLASGYSLLALIALGVLAFTLGDALLVYASLCMAAAVLGFMVWNWPKGRLFLGDGGAYLLGFWLGELAVLMIARHPQISPWVLLLLLSYPVIETLFSIYRRKTMGQKPSHAVRPDSLHLHQLIYRRLVRVFVATRNPDEAIARNSLVAPYIWLMAALLGVAPAVIFRDSPLIIGIMLVVETVLYLLCYRALFKRRFPAFLVLRNTRYTPLRRAYDPD